jgi:hypothetical protein
VAHDRADERPRTHRVRDAEAGGHPAPHRAGVERCRYLLVDESAEAIAVMRARLPDARVLTP